MKNEPELRIRKAREQAGLSLREASEMSREIAQSLRDRRYFASPGSLSEYEATDTAPRHIHKLFTLAILYALRFGELLDCFGLERDHTRMAAIPAEWMVPARTPPAKIVDPIKEAKLPGSGFLANALSRVGEFPFLLRDSILCLSGLEDLSLRDVYWVGEYREIMHPLLDGALLIILNRRKRRPRIFLHKSAWEQPIYLLRRRDGSYRMASCRMENSTIVLHPYAHEFVPPERLRKTAEAEVIGQIVTVIRSLSATPHS
jgi:transcriptional regulator with XRE-family HTH domain